MSTIFKAEELDQVFNKSAANNCPCFIGASFCSVMSQSCVFVSGSPKKECPFYYWMSLKESLEIENLMATAGG